MSAHQALVDCLLFFTLALRECLFFQRLDNMLRACCRVADTVITEYSGSSPQLRPDVFALIMNMGIQHGGLVFIPHSCCIVRCALPQNKWLELVLCVYTAASALVPECVLRNPCLGRGQAMAFEAATLCSL